MKKKVVLISSVTFWRRGKQKGEWWGGEEREQDANEQEDARREKWERLKQLLQ